MIEKSWDVIVIGGGPSGMAAALEAERKGAKTLLLETGPVLGGILNQCIHNGFGLHVFGEELTGPEYADRFRHMVEERKNIRVLTDTMALGAGADLTVTAVSKYEGYLSLQAGAVVMATAAGRGRGVRLKLREHGLPGILTAGAAQKYMNIEGYMVGRECVILGSGDIGLIMARRMTVEGAKVKAVVELMPYSSGLRRNIVQCLDDYGIPLLLSHTVVEIHGKKRVEGVTIAKVDEQKRPVPGTEERISCDCLLLVGGGCPHDRDGRNRPGAKKEGAAIRVDQRFMTSAEGLFICGNTLHVHDLVDNVTAESTLAGGYAAEYAFGRRAGGKERQILHDEAISYVVPQMLRGRPDDDLNLRFRVKKVYKNCKISLKMDNDKKLYSIKKPIAVPGEMETIRIKKGIFENSRGNLTLCLRRRVMTELVCIRCPVGCSITVSKSGQGELEIQGNSCKRGEEYAREEATCPKRIVTCLLPMEGAEEPLSVKTTGGVPKEMVFDVIAEIKRQRPAPPVCIGEVIAGNILGTGVDVVATKTIEERNG